MIFEPLPGNEVSVLNHTANFWESLNVGRTGCTFDQIFEPLPGNEDPVLNHTPNFYDFFIF